MKLELKLEWAPRLDYPMAYNMGGRMVSEAWQHMSTRSLCQKPTRHRYGWLVRPPSPIPPVYRYILIWLATRMIEGLPVARESGLWDSMRGQVDAHSSSDNWCLPLLVFPVFLRRWTGSSGTIIVAKNLNHKSLIMKRR